MNWAQTGFYDIFLRGGLIVEILPEITKLLIFFLITVGIAAAYRKWKPPISA
jgi:ABC-2 type transport system permease protein